MISQLSPALDQIGFALISFQMAFVYNWIRKAFAELFRYIWELERKQPNKKLCFLEKRVDLLEPFLEKDAEPIWKGFFKIFLFGVGVYLLNFCKEATWWSLLFGSTKTHSIASLLLALVGIHSVLREVSDLKIDLHG